MAEDVARVLLIGRQRARARDSVERGGDVCMVAGVARESLARVERRPQYEHRLVEERRFESDRRRDRHRPRRCCDEIVDVRVVDQPRLLTKRAERRSKASSALALGGMRFHDERDVRACLDGGREILEGADGVGCLLRCEEQPVAFERKAVSSGERLA